MFRPIGIPQTTPAPHPPKIEGYVALTPLTAQRSPLSVFFSLCLSFWLYHQHQVIFKHSPKKITHYLLSSGFLNFNHLPNYLPLFTRLSCRQSIWQFSIVVLPPLLHGIMWSASISSNLKVFPHLGQTPFCCS